MTAAMSHPMTVAEYLAWEQDQLEKHEYHRGEIFAMAEASLRHNFLSAAVGRELRAATRPRGCGVLSSNQKVALGAGDRFVYPDVVVVCDKPRMQPGTEVLVNPRVVVEVLSKSTEAYDRGAKWEAYQELPSLTDYVLVAQRAVRVEHDQRSDDGAWQYRTLGPGDVLTLSGGGAAAIDALYEGAFDYPNDE